MSEDMSEGAARLDNSDSSGSDMIDDDIDQNIDESYTILLLDLMSRSSSPDQRSLEFEHNVDSPPSAEPESNSNSDPLQHGLLSQIESMQQETQPQIEAEYSQLEISANANLQQTAVPRNISPRRAQPSTQFSVNVNLQQTAVLQNISPRRAQPSPQISISVAAPRAVAAIPHAAGPPSPLLKPNYNTLLCPICLDTVTQPPDAILARYAALSRLLARPDSPHGPRHVEFRAILGHAEPPPAPGPDAHGARTAIPTPCGHVFHTSCLSLAVAHAAARSVHQACPVCRTTLDVLVCDADDPAALPRLHGQPDPEPHPPAAGGQNAAAGPVPDHISLVASGFDSAPSVAPAPSGRAFYVRGRFVSLEALRAGMRPPRRARLHRAALAAATAGAAAAGIALAVLRFAYHGRVGGL